ncbi:hypothetical protein GGS26DRAFT_571437 [Hypomontagnella submonticulosa]|nr:hypothetical protein GGS26DRAFT_571437 [Hypomontagnella submonticulosa]
MPNRRGAAGIDSDLALQYVTRALENLQNTPVDKFTIGQGNLKAILRRGLTKMVDNIKRDQEDDGYVVDNLQDELDRLQNRFDEMMYEQDEAEFLEQRVHSLLSGQWDEPSNSPSSLSSGGSTSTGAQVINDTPRFHQFTKLPSKVRAMIWDLALPRTFLGEFFIPVSDASFWAFRLVTTMPPPSVAQVCRESRKIACEYGGLMPVKNSSFVPATRSSESLTYRAFQWTWIDLSRDTLGAFNWVTRKIEKM